MVDKPAGLTSNRVLQRVKRIFRAAKAGHTGSLDPMATGMLPICLGTATKVSAWLLDSAKEYRASARFGIATDTGDADGNVIETAEAPPADSGRVQRVLEGMLGESLQLPPMYSALKHKGRRMYELARQGIEVERKPRPIRIERIKLEKLDWPDVEFSVRCSKGTYIRSLAGDIAAGLETIGHVISLRRTRVDPFAAEAMVSLEQLEAVGDAEPERLDRYLTGADAALEHLPRITVGRDPGLALTQGQVVCVHAATAPGTVRIYAPDCVFIGLGELEADGRLRPRRIFCGHMVE